MTKTLSATQLRDNKYEAIRIQFELGKLEPLEKAFIKSLKISQKKELAEIVNSMESNEFKNDLLLSLRVKDKSTKTKGAPKATKAVQATTEPQAPTQTVTPKVIELKDLKIKQQLLLTSITNLDTTIEIRDIEKDHGILARDSDNLSQSFSITEIELWQGFFFKGKSKIDIQIIKK